MHCFQNGVMMLWLLAGLDTSSEFEEALRGEVSLAPLASVALEHHLYHFCSTFLTLIWLLEIAAKGWGKAPVQYRKSGQQALMSQSLQ